MTNETIRRLNYRENAKQCLHCNWITLLPYEYEFTCSSCGYNVIKRKHELSKLQRKRIIFNNRKIISNTKRFCICEIVYKLYEGKV